MSYAFFQEYWWFLISVLGALLVFLLFVQGGQSLFFSLGKDNTDRRLLVNSVGRKWEFTFTTLVVFGGAFFASFPMFYSTSFGGAYWVWMLILICFVIQAVSYEYQNKHGNIWGSKTYQICLFLNGLLGPNLLGTAVSTFFTGANFTIDREAILNLEGANQISQWLPYKGVQLYGLEAVLNPWNVVLGLAIFFLSRTSALLYFINNIEDKGMDRNARGRLAWNAAAFLLFFLPYLSFLLTKEGFALNPETNEIFMQPYKYFHNLMEMPVVLIVMLVGVVLVLTGILMTLLKPDFKKGIWLEGVGVVLTALALFLIAGWNNTAYYPTLGQGHLQESLTIYNSSSSPFTLKAMSYVSLMIPFVAAYMIYAWRALDLHKITKKEIQDPNGHSY